MDRRLRWALGAGLALLLFTPSAALALHGGGTEVPGFGLGPRVGSYKAADADGGKLTGGLQARFRFLPFLAVEGSIDYREQDFADGRIEVRNYPVMVSGLLYFFQNPVVSPYLLAGVGWHYLDIQFNGIPGLDEEKTSEFGVQAGGGVDLPLGDTVTLDADIRYIFLDLDENIQQSVGRDDLNADGFAVTAGLTFYF